ncbi:MAG: PSD1 and planctomycete cytochrome C domain-containing protein [Sediminibacterium sp.]|uniref:PSD1 and planctomycete cytochrome C domain-containing protein n=1 Tax=Sediminibacterium sp. TaxID=1917865 RepID=UPI00271C4D74|nr:PSD1 and planctomycete cytochrome C domain-containing protein [Sediminibacterium sp.]MDO8996898.1 PSD1 and planctomycete cytochrome C domain-containing protein [Sediminibacterium sp.]
MKKTIIVLSLFVAIIIGFISCMNFDGPKQKGLPELVSYNFHIRPILSDKCFSCHGPDANKRAANLRLDIAEHAFAPLTETKGAFAIVAGKPEESELYKRITSKDTAYLMPSPESHLGALSENEIALIKKWIQQGAKYEKHWAFIPPQKKQLPKIKSSDWAKNEIDFFIAASLEQIGLSPNEEADKERLLKRLSLDITGLPPSISLMDQFLNDVSDNAYEKVVDALINTPQYGEKMAVHWLDIARYADSYGYQDDNIRTQWPWRDWVIHAFNKNLPYDQFITWQLAGDMLPNATKEQILATGFFRNHKYTEEGGVIPEEYRMEYLFDKTKTFTKGIQAITLECAQCHDHKYDPFSQKDYYSFLAFFNNTKEKGYEGDVSISKPAKFPILKLTDKEIKQYLSFINKKDTGLITISVMAEDTVRNTYLLNRGVYDQPIGNPLYASAIPAVMKFDDKKFERNRIGLAKWTIDKNNPLTARVFVNQLWQEIFGKGIVKTAGDFGMQGELPSHPDLLDWLAVDFMENGWNIKKLIKKIVMSATYRQSVKTTEEKQKVDPDNIYLSRGPRTRVSAESIRDIVLSTSGLLVKTIGGPSVKPYQPKGLWEGATSGRGALSTYQQDKGIDLYRRGMYTFIKLTLPPPSMTLFDASNRDQCEVKRSKTNTPLQALIMMNDLMVLEASRVLAQQLIAENSSSVEKCNKAFRMIICRKPTAKELDILSSFYNDQLAGFKQGKLDASTTIKVGEYPQITIKDKNGFAALMKTINAIYNMEECITKS